MDSSFLEVGQARRCWYRQPHRTSPPKTTPKTIQTLVRITTAPSPDYRSGLEGLLIAVKKFVANCLDGRSLCDRSYNREQKKPKPPKVGRKGTNPFRFSPSPLFPLLTASLDRDAGERNRPRPLLLREKATTTTAQHMLFPAAFTPLPCSFCQESPCSSNARSAPRFASSAGRLNTPLLTAQGQGHVPSPGIKAC
jgi:hypothetical protein